MQSLSTQQLREHVQNGGIAVDVRQPKIFTSGFLSGSIYLEPGHDFLHRLKAFVKPGEKLVFISDADSGQLLDAPEIDGYEIAGRINFNKVTFNETGLATDMIILIEADEFAMDIKFDDNVVAIDLRDAEEYVQEHLKKSLSLPLPELADVAQIAGLDEEGYIYFYANAEADSLLAASLLKKHGLHDLRVVTGGWPAILREDSLDIVRPKPEKKK